MALDSEEDKKEDDTTKDEDKKEGDGESKKNETDELCKKSDLHYKDCMEKKAQCTTTCNQKCKTEQRDKQKSCISLCVN